MIFKEDSIEETLDICSKTQEKKNVHMLLSENTLEKWDKFRKEKLGNMSRTALIINSVEIYMLILNNQLDTDETAIATQVKQIDSIIQMLNEKLNILKEEDRKIEEEIKDFDKNEMLGFQEVSANILNLIEKWGKLPIETIVEYSKTPDYLVYTTLQKLKAYKKLKVIDGEWELYDRK